MTMKRLQYTFYFNGHILHHKILAGVRCLDPLADSLEGHITQGHCLKKKWKVLAFYEFVELLTISSWKAHIRIIMVFSSKLYLGSGLANQNRTDLQSISYKLNF